jgi:hypothetical protein
MEGQSRNAPDTPTIDVKNAMAKATSGGSQSGDAGDFEKYSRYSVIGTCKQVHAAVQDSPTQSIIPNNIWLTIYTD